MKENIHVWKLCCLIITLHEGRVKNCIEFLIFFRRITFVQSRTQAHFTADDVIISLAATPKFVSCACVRVVSLTINGRKSSVLENWMYCLYSVSKNNNMQNITSPVTNSFQHFRVVNS